MENNEYLTVLSLVAILFALGILFCFCLSAFKFAYARKDKRLAAYRVYLRSLNIDGLIKEIYRNE